MPVSGDIVDAAVRAVKDRDRHFRQWILTVGLFLSGLLALQTVLLYNQSQDTQRTALAARNVAVAQAHIQSEITCALAAETQVTTEYLSKFAKHFGGPVPPVPGLPHQCGGNDPVFIGSSGGDSIDGTSDPDWINGEAGNDILRAHGGGDTIIGDTGNDVIYGGKGTDYLYGGAGNDSIHGGGDSKTDHIDGGTGHDTCYVRSNDVQTNCEQIVRVS